MLQELVYTSIAQPANLEATQLEAILSDSRTWNALHGVSGVLLFYRGEFLQLLEGEHDVVQHLYYDVILRDRRHRGAEICWEQEIDQRSFADWSMARVDPQALPQERAAILEGLIGGGIGALDLAGPLSTGRKVLMAIAEKVLAKA